MEKIKIKILNKSHLKHIEKMVTFTARLTQRGHKLKTMEDVINLYDSPYKSLKPFCTLPHPTLQKFGTIDIVIFGASRRFLAQITRHQNEVKFMSASLQYSDYSDGAEFVVPKGAGQDYSDQCQIAMEGYRTLAKEIGHDNAGYLMPQGLRNVLIISATPYQWKHMINQRVCRRNTDETRFVMQLIWKELEQFEMFKYGMGPSCMQGGCLEGKMSCNKPMTNENKFDL